MGGMSTSTCPGLITEGDLDVSRRYVKPLPPAELSPAIVERYVCHALELAPTSTAERTWIGRADFNSNW